MSNIIIKGLTQNNLKIYHLKFLKIKLLFLLEFLVLENPVSYLIQLQRESQRQMNETYSSFIRNRLPKYRKPQVELIDNLTASVIVDQTPLGGNARSTVGTISDLYSSLRLLFSRIGEPYIGTTSYFSFNDPNGMCKNCSGIGRVKVINIESIINPENSWNTGCINDSLFKPNSWYWKQYAESGLLI